MMMMDIKNYYIATPLPRLEYMEILLSRFPKEIIQKYNINALAVDSLVYIEIQKGMYQQVATNTFSTIGVLPCKAHPGTMVTQDSANIFHSHRGRFAIVYLMKQHA
jgi:hypothetical protein